jgi:hypothetical protein
MSLKETIKTRIIDLNHYLISKFVRYDENGNRYIETSSNEYEILYDEIIFLENLINK